MRVGGALSTRDAAFIAFALVLAAGAFWAGRSSGGGGDGAGAAGPTRAAHPGEPVPVPATAPARPEPEPAGPDEAPSASDADHADAVRSLEAKLAHAYVVGGAADPIDFPPNLDPAHSPAQVQAWADALTKRCPAASGAWVETDCGEFPCIIAVGWTGSAPPADVLCQLPDLAGGHQAVFEGEVDGTLVQGALIPVGPEVLPEPIDDGQFERRWDVRQRAIRDLLVQEVLAER